MRNSNPLRIILFSCAGSPLSAGIIDYIRRERPDVLKEIVAVVLSRPKPRPLSEVKRLPDKDNLPHFYWLYAIQSKCIDGFRWRLNKFLIGCDRIIRHFMTRFRPMAYRYIEDFCLLGGINTYVTDKVNSEETVRWLRFLSPDIIVVSTFHYILKREVIDLPTIATLNVHCSLLPKYRGPDPINAALQDGVNETGVTIHWVDEGIDTGDIVLQREVSIGNASSEAELRPALSLVAGQLLLECIEQARLDRLHRHPQSERAK
jgi:folate-dependent phosphoribosylglycinamide formyltransferase PurN